MKRFPYLFALLMFAANAFASGEDLFWVEGMPIWPPFDRVSISTGEVEDWTDTNQLDWMVSRQDMLDRLMPVWVESSRSFAAAPWLYEDRGLWTAVVDGVPVRSFLVPDLPRAYVRSMSPSLLESAELLYGGASYLYGFDSAMGVVAVRLPDVSLADETGGSNELYGRVSTLEREQSAWWRASLWSSGVAAVGEISGSEWETDAANSLSREQFLRFVGAPISRLHLNASAFSRHLNDIASETLFADFDSNQFSFATSYERGGYGLTHLNLSASVIELDAHDGFAAPLDSWRWFGGRLVSGFRAGWVLRVSVGFEGMWESAKFVENGADDAGADEADAALGAGFALFRFEPAAGLEIAPGIRYDRVYGESRTDDFYSPSLRVSYSPSSLWNFIASYDRSELVESDDVNRWDSWKFGFKITDERVRSVFGVGYFDSEPDNPWAFGRMRIFLGYNWRFDFACSWIRWDDDYHHLWGNGAVRFSGIDGDWWVEWSSSFASNRRLSGYFWRHDIYARFRFFRYLALRAGVENILDRRYNVELMSFDKRNYRFQLEFLFGI